MVLHWDGTGVLSPSSLTANSSHYHGKLIFSFTQKEHNEIELMVGNMEHVNVDERRLQIRYFSAKDESSRPH